MKIGKYLGAAAGAVLIGTAAEIALLLSKKPAPELPDPKDHDYYSADADGRKFEDLYLFLTGRKKNLIILSNGENISPENIEDLLPEETLPVSITVDPDGTRTLSWEDA